MSAIGTKRTSRHAQPMSAFGGKADVAFLELNVRLIVSTGVTVHFLFGAIVVANLPRLYKSFGVATVTKGRVYRIARIPNGVTRHRDRDDRDDLDFVRRVLFKDTGQNGTKR